jgi:hypothetical protein
VFGANRVIFGTFTELRAIHETERIDFVAEDRGFAVAHNMPPWRTKCNSKLANELARVGNQSEETKYENPRAPRILSWLIGRSA